MSLTKLIVTLTFHQNDDLDGITTLPSDLMETVRRTESVRTVHPPDTVISNWVFSERLRMLSMVTEDVGYLFEELQGEGYNLHEFASIHILPYTDERWNSVAEAYEPFSGNYGSSVQAWFVRGEVL